MSRKEDLVKLYKRLSKNESEYRIQWLKLMPRELLNDKFNELIYRMNEKRID